MKLSSLLLPLLFLFFLIQSVDLPSGSRILPMAFSSLGLLFSLVQLGINVIKHRKTVQKDQSSQPNVFNKIAKNLQDVSLFLWIIIFGVLILLVGTIIAIPVFMFLLTRYYYKEAFKVSVLMSVGCALFYYFVFVKLLAVPPYNGIIF